MFRTSVTYCVFPSLWLSHIEQNGALAQYVSLDVLIDTSSDLLQNASSNAHEERERENSSTSESLRDDYREKMCRHGRSLPG